MCIWINSTLKAIKATVMASCNLRKAMIMAFSTEPVNNKLVISLIKKTLPRNLNFTLNIKAAETCYLPWWKKVNKTVSPNFMKTTWRIFVTWCNMDLKFYENIDNLERIANIFNNYFNTIGEKTQAKIKQSHKKSKSNCTNYHPISLLSNLHKILEKLICSRLSTFLNIKDIIYPL